MNRSILIVICDFLLVSLLAFSSVDINQAADQGAERTLNINLITNQAESGKDLAAAMRLALDEERKQRDVLQGELERTRSAGEQRQALLVERERQVERLMSEHEGQVRALQQDLQSREQGALRLQEEQLNLRQRLASAQADVQSLNQRLQSNSTETLISREKLAAMEAELRRQSEQAAALQQQLDRLARSNLTVLNEKQQLATRLQVAEVEKRHAVELADRMREEVDVQRQEKATLAEGVKTLASKSGELAQEIRENRPLAPNTIFHEFVANRVHAYFLAVRAGLFGVESGRQKEIGTVLVADRTNIFALCHVDDTPLTLWNPGTDWLQLDGQLARNESRVPIKSLSFHLQDPRVVFVPVTEAEARQLGGKVYRVSSDPYKFQDAILVGAQEGYYGECKFELDLTTPGYVKLDRSLLKGLFGKFNPSRGDLVFSRTGELLGVMANDTYCMTIRDFNAAAMLRFGPNSGEQRTGQVLSALYSRVAALPSRLQ